MACPTIQIARVLTARSLLTSSYDDGTISAADNMLRQKSRDLRWRQVHWLRLVLDEGHTLGALAATNKMTCAVNLRAELRWIMTGTPTPGGVAGEVRHLLPLLQILRHQPYGTNEALWRVRPGFLISLVRSLQHASLVFIPSLSVPQALLTEPCTIQTLLKTRYAPSLYPSWDKALVHTTLTLTLFRVLTIAT